MEWRARNNPIGSKRHPDCDSQGNRQSERKRPNRAGGHLFRLDGDRDQCRFGDRGGKPDRRCKDVHPQVRAGRPDLAFRQPQEFRRCQLGSHASAQGKQGAFQSGAKEGQPGNDVAQADQFPAGTTQRAAQDHDLENKQEKNDREHVREGLQQSRHEVGGCLTDTGHDTIP